VVLPPKGQKRDNTSLLTNPLHPLPVLHNIDIPKNPKGDSSLLQRKKTSKEVLLVRCPGRGTKENGNAHCLALAAQDCRRNTMGRRSFAILPEHGEEHHNVKAYFFCLPEAQVRVLPTAKGDKGPWRQNSHPRCKTSSRVLYSLTTPEKGKATKGNSRCSRRSREPAGRWKQVQSDTEARLLSGLLKVVGGPETSRYEEKVTRFCG